MSLLQDRADAVRVRTDAPAELAGKPWSRPPGLLALVLLCGVVALAWRLPGLLQLELNMDEALYRLIGRSLAEGHAPYTVFWDRKPVGTFLVTALIDLGLGDGLVAFRLVSALFVGATALLMTLCGRVLFPAMPLVGPLGGVLYILFSVRNGGEGTNTELLYTPLGLVGLLCLLLAAGRQTGAARLRLGFLAGIAFGAALQVKQFALFDMLAYGAIHLLLARDGPAARALPRLAALAAVGALGTLLPTLLVLGWYAAIGQLGTWVEANVTTNLGVVGGETAGLNLDGLATGLRGFGPLVLGTVAGLAAAPLLAEGRAAWRGVLALVVWLAAMALSLLFSRRFADHFFLQVLPPLTMATAFAMVLAARALAAAIPRLARWTRLALLGGTALLGVVAGAGMLDAAAETLWRRQAQGIAHWGDRTATLGAAIGGRVEGPGDLYVFGRWLGLYAATGTTPPTRFPFALHLFSGYAPVDGAAEIERILGRKPRFVVVEERWLGWHPPPQRPEAAAVLAALRRALARDYVTDGRVGLFRSWGGGHVGGEVDAVVFRRRDVSPPLLAAGLHYRPAASP